MKKILSLAVVVSLAIATLMCFTACGETKSVDEQFIGALTDGLSARWVLTNKDNEDNDKQLTKSDYEGYINAEYDRISDFKEATFEDEELGNLAKEYIDLIEQSKETLDYYNNYDKWHVDWTNVRHDRAEVLVNINEIVPLVFSNEADTDQFNGIISEGKIIKSVREIMETTEFKETDNEYGWKTFSAVIENTTNVDFDYFYFDIKLIDKDGVTIRTETSGAENWKSGEKTRFTFETSEKFKKMEIDNCWYDYQ